MLIGLSGYARSGKDTVGAILTERFGYARRSFADAVRAGALAIDPVVCSGRDGLMRLSSLVGDLGWETAKNLPEVRRLLQRIGTDFGRSLLGENVWVDAAFQGVSPGQRIVFTDCRFPNEASAVRASGGLMVRVERPGVVSVNSHVSERALDDWTFDEVIENDGSIDKLERIVCELVGESLRLSA